MIQKLGIGSVQFGLPYGISNKSGQTSQLEVADILKYCRDKKINFIDTAIAYGDSQKVLGKAGVKDFNVISKFIVSSEDDLVALLQQTLTKLKISKLYAFLSHRPSDILNNHIGLWGELNELKSKGVISKIGFSFNDPEEIIKMKAKGISPDLIQVPFNYLDHRFKEYMIALKQEGCEVHSRSSFLQGLFFLNEQYISHYFDPVKPIIKELKSEYKNNEQLAAALLKYALSQDFIDKVILGVNNCQQLRNNVINLKQVKIPDEKEFQINEAILTPSKWPKS